MRTASAKPYSAIHLDDAALRQEASRFAAGERSNLVQFLVCIAEIDSRRLYGPEGFASMLEFCMEEYGFSEDEALKRIQVARIAKDLPILFEALEEGHLCVKRIGMLATHLTPENVTELIEAGKRHPRASDFRHFLDRFARPELLITSPPCVPQTPALGSAIGFATVEGLGTVDNSPAPEQVSCPPDTQDHALPQVQEWVNLRIKAPKGEWEHVRNLLSHSVPSGDASKIFVHMLRATIEKAEKQKFAASKKPRGPRPGILRRQRTIPAHVRRAVVERDGGQCTFVSESGRRCTSKRLLEYDHVLPVAKGGKATVEGIRLRCRLHNQYEAEKAFGAQFMEKKREEARQARARRAEVGSCVADAPPPGQRLRDDVMAGLQALGVAASEARQIVERSGELQQTTLEKSRRAALRCCGPRRGARSA